MTLGDLGLDSLMSVEVMQTIERELDLVLTPAEVRELTLKSIKNMQSKDSDSNKTSSENGKFSLYL